MIARFMTAAVVLALGAAVWSAPAYAQDAGVKWPAPAPEIGHWRFRHADRPIKVVVLAGSIGAWKKQPYAGHLRNMCTQIEVKNLSLVGQGAWALKNYFRYQVLANPRIPKLHRAPEGTEYWLVFHGGLNSVGRPEGTNRHIRALNMLAHGAGFGVVGFTLTPWGDEADQRRWRGIRGLHYLDATRKVVDFVMGRLSPREALGQYASRRDGGAAAPWLPSELPDVSIDLYDSALRDVEAEPRPIEALETELARDRKWQAAHADFDEAARAAALTADARRAAEIPRWYLRKTLRAFDHIHPNADGHRLIAQTACPKLPASWGCRCPP